MIRIHSRNSVYTGSYIKYKYRFLAKGDRSILIVNVRLTSFKNVKLPMYGANFKVIQIKNHTVKSDFKTETNSGEG